MFFPILSAFLGILAFLPFNFYFLGLLVSVFFVKRGLKKLLLTVF